MATVVFVHAHPDDEAILTAGTMRALALAGHRVVLVLATDGGAGLTSDRHAELLGQKRLREAEASANALGIDSHVWLGYADSGLDGAARHELETFCSADVDDAAQRLAAILRTHQADIVVGYDQQGGYGHPDHIQVHHVVARAAILAEIANVFEATLSRERIRKTLTLLRPLAALQLTALNNLLDGFSSNKDITHRVDVTSYLGAKRDSMRAHASQTVGGGMPRSLRILLALPDRAFGSMLGTEFYVQTRGDISNNAIAELKEASLTR